MTTLNDSPFAILTAVVAPALLTNACSLLSLGTANRIARVVDRTRVVTAARGGLTPGDPKFATCSHQLDQLQTRGKLLLRALRSIYTALGAFAASALSAVVGSALASYDLQFAFHAAVAMGFVIGTLAVTMLVTGCTLMVRETRLGIQSMTEEIERSRVPEK